MSCASSAAPSRDSSAHGGKEGERVGREGSMHNGGEREATKAMNWGIKIKFGSDTERPV